MSTQLNQVNITQVTWRQAESHLREVRTKVFIDEQQVPIDLEWDDGVAENFCRCAVHRSSRLMPQRGMK